MKPPSEELFDELLARRNSRVTRNPLRKWHFQKKNSKFKLRALIFWHAVIPDEEKCVNRIRCVAQNLEAKRLFSDDFAILLGPGPETEAEQAPLNEMQKECHKLDNDKFNTTILLLIMLNFFGGFNNLFSSFYGVILKCSEPVMAF